MLAQVGTGVGIYGTFASAGGCVAIDRCSTLRAAQQAREHVTRVRAPGVVHLAVDMLGLFEARLVFLDGLPEIEGHDRWTVILNHQIGEFERADIELVWPKGDEGAEAVIDARGAHDIQERRTGRAHLEGFEHQGCCFGVWVPAMGDVRGAIAAMAEGDWCAFEARGRCARDAAIFGYQFALAAADIDGEVFEVLVIFVIDDRFDDAPDGSFGYVVRQAEEGVAEGAHFGAVEDGIIQAAAEAVVRPDDDGLDRCRVAKIVHEFLELVTAGGRSAPGFVDIEAGNDQAVLAGPFAQAVLLLLGG